MAFIGVQFHRKCTWHQILKCVKITDMNLTPCGLVTQYVITRSWAISIQVIAWYHQYWLINQTLGNISTTYQLILKKNSSETMHLKILFTKFGPYCSGLYLNSLWPSNAIYCQTYWSKLIEGMACCLFGTKALPEPMLSYWTPRDKVCSVKFE